jgi:hypothetical protein
MKLNWRAAAQTGLSALGGQMSNNYENMQKEQMLMRAEDRRYQTEMAKTKEIGKMKTERVAKERNTMAEEMTASGNYSPEEIASARTGAPLSGEYQNKQALDQKGALLDLGIEKSEEQANKHEAKILAIVENAPKDPNGNPKYSAMDKMLLAINGIKTAEPKPMSDAVRKDVWKVAGVDAKERASVDNLEGGDAITMANTYLKRNGQRHTIPKGPGGEKAARQYLIDVWTTEGYAKGISTISGVMPKVTPSGEMIPESVFGEATTKEETVMPRQKPPSALGGFSGQTDVEPKIVGEDAQWEGVEPDMMRTR